MKTSKFFTRLLLISLLSGCSTMKKSVSLGALSGASLGAVSGSTVSQKYKSRGALKGAAVGALLGGLASYFIHDELLKRDKKIRKETLFNLDRYGAMPETMSTPANINGITFPVESEEFIPTHRKGNRVIEQHRIWSISDDIQWSKSNRGKNER